LKRGAKLKVPLGQLEERFRTVYTNADRNGLELTINALEKKDSRNWEKLGYEKTKTFDFHDSEGLLTLLGVNLQVDSFVNECGYVAAIYNFQHILLTLIFFCDFTQVLKIVLIKYQRNLVHQLDKKKD
jgi:hypothetical protein